MSEGNAERLEHLERLAVVRSFMWACGRADCDGLPHRGFPHKHARDSQLAPEGDWHVWLIMSGRGWGKTRTGAEWVKGEALRKPGTRWAIVAPTYADARDTCIEGESGLLAVLPEDRVEAWNRSLGEVVLTNGSRVKLFSADEPERLRGPQHHGAWCDEVGAWRYPDTWDQLQFGLRLGDNPRTVVTTTPKPTTLLRGLVEREGLTVHITRGRTLDNAANLSAHALAELQARYSGTRLGRQELEGELLTDMPGALWASEMISAQRVELPLETVIQKLELHRRQRDFASVVAIDPAVTNTETSDETGIIAAARSANGWCPICGEIDLLTPHAFILSDHSGKFGPAAWAAEAIDLYDYVEGAHFVVEVNNGGDLVSRNLRVADPTLSEGDIHSVTATRGKERRAQPIAQLYEQGRVHHVGTFGVLEDQMTTWTPEADFSPDRMDALVWALTDLMLGKGRSYMRMRGAA